MVIRAPWWAFVALFAAGFALAYFWPAPSDAAMDELRAAVVRAEHRADSLASVADSAARTADAALEDHAALVTRSDSTISALNQRIQTTTARATEISAEIRSQVDEETAGLLTELEAEWEGRFTASRAQTAEWMARALSAEAGWQDERLARAAAQQQVEAERAVTASQSAIIRAQDAVISSLNRKRTVNRVVAVAGAGWLCYDAIAEGRTYIAVGSCGAGVLAAVGG